MTECLLNIGTANNKENEEVKKKNMAYFKESLTRDSLLLFYVPTTGSCAEIQFGGR